MLSQVIEIAGIVTSKGIKYPLKKWIKRKVEACDIEVLGIENINQLKNKPFVLVSNHLKSFDNGLLKSGISMDSFVIRKIISSNTGKEMALAVNYLLGSQWVLKKYLEQFTKGFIFGLGCVPVGKGRKSFHDVFLKSVEKVVSQKRPILIYPVGVQHEDFEKEHEIKAGAGYIALKYNLPIAPVYIKGAHEWNKKKQVVYLSFGKPFSVQNLTIDQVNKRIKKEILKLKLKINS